VVVCITAVVGRNANAVRPYSAPVADTQ
jgi:hypothetical protein